MENEEMKQKNEEILARWRGLGVLAGLKEGSINEWRCAKSFDDMANLLLNDENLEQTTLSVYAFPFIRRVLCTGKKRLYRLINPSEIVDFFTTTTISDCHEFLQNEWGPVEIKSKSLKNWARKAFYNILSYDAFKDETLLQFFDNMRLEKNESYKTLNGLMGNLFDFEAELLATATNLFVEIKSKKEG